MGHISFFHAGDVNLLGKNVHAVKKTAVRWSLVRWFVDKVVRRKWSMYVLMSHEQSAGKRTMAWRQVINSMKVWQMSNIWDGR